MARGDPASALPAHNWGLLDRNFILRVPACTVNNSIAEIISKAHLVLDFIRLRDF